MNGLFVFVQNDFQQKETLGAEYFLCTEPEGSSGAFKAKQVISETFVVSTLASYVIVPATFRPFQQGDFVFKVMVDRKLGTELKKLIPPTRPSQKIKINSAYSIPNIKLICFKTL